MQIKHFSAIASLILAASPIVRATEAATAQADPSWSSPSLRSETVVGPNGAITTNTALLANGGAASGIGRAAAIEFVAPPSFRQIDHGLTPPFL